MVTSTQSKYCLTERRGPIHVHKWMLKIAIPSLREACFILPSSKGISESCNRSCAPELLLTPSVVEALLDSGARSEIQCNLGKTALQMARDANAQEIVAILDFAEAK